MKRLSIGKLKGLQQIADQSGIFNMCAIDHRGSLRQLICQEEDEVCDGAMIDFKLELCSHLAPYASAVLLDPIYGAAQCISHGVIPKDSGLLVSLEATGYAGDRENRRTRLLEGWSVAKTKRMGASAVKLLLYYRPDLNELAAQQLDTVNAVARDCIEHDIPLLVEAVSYPVGDEVSNPRLFAEHKARLVIDTARDITGLPIDILKAEFPDDLRYKADKSELSEHCRELDAASPVPWVILSAGVDYELFRRQVEIACRAGASGFLAGRAIWQEAVAIENVRQRSEYLGTVAVERLKELNEIAGKYAVPWYRKLGLSADALAGVSQDWYLEY
ncbi:MAG: tagatose 1,6-diphosphate aldolase [Dehalococcoidales bacterium]|nr:tagatose 1,6-diphosphate aldolase [Dehalococcoidales bacterium]